MACNGKSPVMKSSNKIKVVTTKIRITKMPLSLWATSIRSTAKTARITQMVLKKAPSAMTLMFSTNRMKIKAPLLQMRQTTIFQLNHQTMTRNRLIIMIMKTEKNWTTMIHLCPHSATATIFRPKNARDLAKSSKCRPKNIAQKSKASQQIAKTKALLNPNESSPNRPKKFPAITQRKILSVSLVKWPSNLRLRNRKIHKLKRPKKTFSILKARQIWTLPQV